MAKRFEGIITALATMWSGQQVAEAQAQPPVQDEQKVEQSERSLETLIKEIPFGKSNASLGKGMTVDAIKDQYYLVFTETETQLTDVDTVAPGTPSTSYEFSLKLSGEIVSGTKIVKKDNVEISRVSLSAEEMQSADVQKVIQFSIKSLYLNATRESTPMS